MVLVLVLVIYDELRTRTEVPRLSRLFTVCKYGSSTTYLAVAD